MKSIIVKNEVFRIDTEVILCSSDKEFDKVIKHINDKIPWIQLHFTSEMNDWFFYHHEWRWYIVFRTQDISVIAHELIHLIFYICDDRWIPTRIENDETFAYLMWYYMKEIVEWLKIKKVVTTRSKS